MLIACVYPYPLLIILRSKNLWRNTRVSPSIIH
uniref:Uncharacterized protein n=1 Tax=Lepeophtheirus salmonis TaxID=72036 RepID=A0A0K2VDF7_LEPSM